MVTRFTFFFFFKQKTAYEISTYWSSDVCSSDLNFYTLMLNFTSGGFYLAFLFPLLANVVIRLRGGWTSGPFTLGRWSMVVSVVALVWALFQFLKIGRASCREGV